MWSLVAWGSFPFRPSIPPFLSLFLLKGKEGKQEREWARGESTTPFSKVASHAMPRSPWPSPQNPLRPCGESLYLIQSRASLGLASTRGLSLREPGGAPSGAQVFAATGWKEQSQWCWFGGCQVQVVSCFWTSQLDLCPDGFLEPTARQGRAGLGGWAEHAGGNRALVEGKSWHEALLPITTVMPSSWGALPG